MNPARYIIRFLFTGQFVRKSRGGGTSSMGMQVPELLPVVGDETTVSQDWLDVVEQMPGTYG